MTPHQIVAVSIRLVALVWVLYTLSHLHELFSFLREDSQVRISTTVVWGFALFQIIVCLLLWLFPRTVAAWLLPGKGAYEVAPPPRLIEWQTLGVICIGIWALTRAIPDAVYWTTFYNMMGSSVRFSDLNPEQRAGIVGTIFELVLGFWLLLGAKGLAALLFKIRTAGQ